MQPGKKMDQLVAQHVLEWKLEGDRWMDPSSGAEAVMRPFSEDATSAWIVADRICEGGFRLQIDGSRIWQARFYKSTAHTLETKAFSATGRTPAEAICLAALTLKGVSTS